MITRQSDTLYHADWNDYSGGNFSHYWIAWFYGRTDAGNPVWSGNAGKTSETTINTNYLYQNGEYLFRVQVINGGNTVKSSFRNFMVPMTITTATHTATPTATLFSAGPGLPLTGGDEKPLTQVNPAQNWWLAPLQIAPWIPKQIAGLFRPWVIALTLVILAGIGFGAWRATRKYE